MPKPIRIATRIGKIIDEITKIESDIPYLLVDPTYKFDQTMLNLLQDLVTVQKQLLLNLIKFAEKR